MHYKKILGISILIVIFLFISYNMVNKVKDLNHYNDSLSYEIEELKNIVDVQSIELNKYKSEIDSLNSQIIELSFKIDNISLTEQNLMKTIDIANKFTEAFLSYDKNILNIYLSENFIVSKDGIINNDTNDITYFVKSNNNFKYSLNSYGMIDGQMFYQYAITDVNSNSSGFFINLFIKHIDGSWYVNNIELDI